MKSTLQIDELLPELDETREEVEELADELEELDARVAERRGPGTREDAIERLAIWQELIAARRRLVVYSTVADAIQSLLDEPMSEARGKVTVKKIRGVRVGDRAVYAARIGDFSYAVMWRTRDFWMCLDICRNVRFSLLLGPNAAKTAKKKLVEWAVEHEE